MRAIVQIRFDVEGFHYYPDAPKKVSFLSSNHRHTFSIECGYEVFQLNREKEIFIQREIVKEYLDFEYGEAPYQFGAMSCEMIAKNILQYFKSDGMVYCQVWEENTGGAKVEL